MVVETNERTATATPQFSMELNEEQRQIQKWVHGFAKDVIRPAAHEWDEREETPWPIIQEASKIGLYSFEFLQNAFADPTGLTMPVANEELFWGDAGIGLAIMGSTLCVAGREPDAGSDVSSLKSRAVYDEAKDEWVLNGTKTWITNGGIADVHVLVLSVAPELNSRGHAAFIVPPGTPGIRMGQKFKKHGIRASHTAEGVLEDCHVPGSC